MTASRDSVGRFRPGTTSPNPAGRPKRAAGVDAAITRALSEKITVVKQGRRTRRSKLDVTAAQLANKGAGGDIRATKLAFEQVRKAEERTQAQATREPIMTETDQEIAQRVIARLRQIIAGEGTS